ncbi:MAG: M48 family metallopeptidase [Desulfopila sp.]|jgi:Zn-dependent protease with chaperone function/uncharacterized tellurite resistance protein B-like protein|nr:M48 family metallopeptidase [Desulfopila sp.]
MDFFTAQDHARRNTGRLVFFFFLAVLSLIVLTNLVVMLVFGFFQPVTDGNANQPAFDWTIFFGIGTAVVMIVALGSLYKVSRLSRGGDAIAAMYGAKPVFADDPDLSRQRLVHIVEEMAIASGTPVPQVYVLDEEGINAFAAGFSTSDAIIAVTKGALRTLNREQLQGVIAHEFSHILNGDMRLNIRLVGILHGILLLGLIGHYILRGSSGSGKKGGGVLLGLGLLMIGYAGTFFGKIIKAAVSRQREFLADAAAVQFTRNPDGIGGALLRIGAHQKGSLLADPKTEELSHALFGQGTKIAFTSLFATHPRLEDRIRRILPDWDGTLPAAGEDGPIHEKMSGPSGPAAATAGFTSGSVVSRIGRPGNDDINKAKQLLKNIDDVFLRAARDPFSAQAVLLYLILDNSSTVREQQLSHLKSSAAPGISPEIRKLIRTGRAVQAEERLALVELSLPSLRRLSEKQAQLFLGNLNSLIRIDGKITLFEWCLLRIVSSYIDDYFKKPIDNTTTRIHDLEQVGHECAMVLSVLAYSTRHDGLEQSEVFSRAIKETGLPATERIPAEHINLASLQKSLQKLQQLSPQAKALFIKGCVSCVLADGKIDPVEAELLRSVAATLSVPMPPTV